jgi:catechol 2,3-dioxygenase-like lactoylglutathione lyase family enzyme
MGKDMAKVQATASASHLGVVVKDIDAAKQMLKTLFGIGPWWSVVADVGKDLMIAGEPFKVKVAHARLLENTTIELVEPMGSSLWADFIATTGGGVHHICYDVTNWQEMVDTVESLGGKMLVAANVFGKKFCYMRLPTGLVVEFADEHIHADAEKLLRSKPLPAMSLDGGHIGTIVKDTNQAKELYKILGYETWWTREVSLPQDVIIIGGDAFSLKVSDTLLAGRTILELLEPISSGSLWDKFAKTSNGSMHHIGFEVTDWQAIIDKIKGVGGKMVFGADVWGKTAYMHLPIGLILEIQTVPSHAEAQKMFGIIE